MRYFRVEVPGDRINIYPLVCWHLGAKQSSHKFIERVIAEIKRDPHARWIYMGDAGECVTNCSKGNVFEQLISPGAQLRLAGDLLIPIKHKAIGGVRGNHGNRIDKETGLGWDETLCSRIGIPYFGVAAFGDILFKGRNALRSTFSIFVHHGSASAITSGGKVTAGYKPSQIVEADVILTAHTHACGELFSRHFARTNGHCRRIDWRTQRAYVCGSAYDSRSGYAEEKMYQPILPEHLVISVRQWRTDRKDERRTAQEFTYRKIQGFAVTDANREDLYKWGWE